MLGVALGRSVLALRILRPVKREAVADQPLAEIGAVHRAGRNSPSVLIQRDRDAAHRSTRDESVEIVRGFRAAAILLAVVAPAELGSLGRVDAPQADARAVDFECVTVDDAGLAGQLAGRLCSSRGPFRRTAQRRTAISKNSCTERGTSSYSAKRRRNSSAISTVTSRDQPSAVLKATMRTG
jgi:hypothetical protein